MWLLCMLAASTLAASGAMAGPMSACVLALFVGELLLAGGFLLPWVPSQGEAAIIVGGACAWHLLRPDSRTFASVAAGACAALGTMVQVQQGAPATAATIVAMVIVGSALRLGPRSGFAPSRMREQALTGLVLAAPVIGALPGVMSGWESAVTINLAANARAVERFPDWVWQFVVAMLALGVLRQFWVRK